MKRLTICSIMLGFALTSKAAVAQITTSQYDNLRTGATLDASSDDYLRDYAIANGHIVLSKTSNVKFENPGATPAISANESDNAVVWAVATKTWNGADRSAIVYAFDAKNINQPIYTSEQNSKRDRAALATRFVIPVVANGRVYIAARGEVDVYGLVK